MPLVTNLIDDKSPLILYDSTWTPGNSAGDAYEDQYYLGTFTTNSVTNGAVSLSFNGTGVWIYGAKRSNYNTYTVQLDSATYGPYDGYYPTQEFLQVLFNQTGLTQGMHNLTLTNTGTNGTYVDIDLVGILFLSSPFSDVENEMGIQIVWQSEVGSSNQELITETVQNTDPRFQFLDSAWTSPSNVNFYSNGTGQCTGTNAANAVLTFTVRWSRCSAQPRLPPGPTSFRWTRGNPSDYNGTTFLPYYGVTLFHADNLDAGQHSLTITNAPASPGQQLCIDYALVSDLSE
ncbi:hypothetical protein F5J12DRAFT_897632 [Pisolithus orientalis]|uniref:uncharacterized protein n=1 Tax=Pisolithus orientalis TaxID=936130 RepID=UPI0022245895|nr:uncharacterized protein F5J12DRAFT_897632 [Pisolithus orientalis]KAI5990835.1 hypothetical protein F5J12DRAFT_897632 [Pisolithus orientalis]